MAVYDPLHIIMYMKCHQVGDKTGKSIFTGIQYNDWSMTHLTNPCIVEKEKKNVKTTDW